MEKGITLSLELSNELKSLVHEYLKENMVKIVFEMSSNWPYKNAVITEISTILLRSPEYGIGYNNKAFLDSLVAELVKKIDDDKLKMMLLEALIKKN